jgi:glycosyltransferase involved in cell wall biosynthesis
MSYPFVLFYRFDKYEVIDSFFLDNNENLKCTIHIINDLKKLNCLFDPNYQILITYGEDVKEYYQIIDGAIPERMSKRWIHFKEITSVESFNNSVNNCFIYNASYSRENIRPIFSIFTTCFNSYEKIIRAYKSIKNQTFMDWEWVIVDDSSHDNHFNFLRDNFLDDSRVRMYKRSGNSGNIGNVKNEAVSLCRGKYVVELDHDDEILRDVLKDSVELFESNNDVGFIYMNFANIHENGDNFKYGDFICKGYGSYYCQKYEGKWVYVYNTPNINNITLSHLVCCPNHPRIWRREILLQAGNYCEMLPICDDYEIILRTCLITKTAKIKKLGYIQYMNSNNNNFSLIRNGEINRIGPEFIMPIFYEKFKIHDFMKEQNAYEDEKYIWCQSQLWKRDDKYENKKYNILVNNDYEKQICIIGIENLDMNIELIKELYKNPKNDFILLDNCNIESLFKILDEYDLIRFKCYSLDSSYEELEKYFKRMYLTCANYEIFKIKKIKNNTELKYRHEVINLLTNKNDRYLEIGVEYGFNFKNVHFINKEGVDPDPKCETTYIKIQTSDEYFSKDQEPKDVIFIDGMHQSEYVLRDLNNSIKILRSNGKIFLDDIIPSNYYEQLKVPRKHFYEKGILKYGEPWTGDVWKVMYYVLLNFSENIAFSYYNNKNYRGIGCIQIKTKFAINEEAISIINNYEYKTDFEKYIKLLSSINKPIAHEIKLNLAFYTCFYGSDNNLAFKIPNIPSLKYNCYYYTNNKTIFEKLKETNWIGIYDNKPTKDDLIESCMVGKHVKTMPHLYNEIKNYDYLCFLDSKLDKINEIFIENFIIKYFIEDNYALLLRKHWYINNKVWDEYDESINQERYRLESNKYKNYINNQIKNGLSEVTEHHCACGILIRNMKHEKTNKINETWYEHIQECGIQDQISFFFVKQLFEGHTHSFNENIFSY